MLIAKKMFLVLFSMGIIFTFPACGHKDSPRPNPLVKVLTTPKNDDLPLIGIYDDNKHTVYIKVSDISCDFEDDAVAELMLKKRGWEEINPTKTVVAMAAITGDWGGNGHPVLVGLLIHYEFQPTTPK